MTDSKKTEPVDNFPYLVYTDEAGRTYDGNGGGSIPIHEVTEFFYFDEYDEAHPLNDVVGEYNIIDANGDESEFSFSYPENPIKAKAGESVSIVIEEPESYSPDEVWIDNMSFGNGGFFIMPAFTDVRVSASSII